MKDSPISFPGLFGDWKFTASSTALNLGHGVYWYGIILATGVLVGLWLCSRQAHRFGLKEDNLLDLVLWGVPVGILGARTYYVIFYYSLYRTDSGGPDWSKIVAIWDGGLAIYGTVIAVFLLAIIYCRHKRIRLGAMTDLCVMGLLVGQAIGRWGNFMNREAFGAQTTLPWRMRLWTSAASYIDVHPTFFYESLWNVIGLLLLLFIVTKARRFDGENTWFYFLWYGMGRTWVEGLRTDSLYLFNWSLFGQPVRVSQALSMVMVLISAGVLFYEIRIRKHDPKDLLVNQLAAAAAGDGTDVSAAPDGAVTEDSAPEAADTATEGPMTEKIASEEKTPAGETAAEGTEAEPEDVTPENSADDLPDSSSR